MIFMAPTSERLVARFAGANCRYRARISTPEPNSASDITLSPFSAMKTLATLLFSLAALGGITFAVPAAIPVPSDGPDEIALAKCPTPVQKTFRETGSVNKVLKITEKD